MDKEMLKEKLIQAAENQKLETASIEVLLPLMLPHIGDRDPILRDRLIYGLASEWITKGMVSPKLMNSIMAKLITDEYLHGDEIYTRSFTTLWIAALLYRHRMEAFLSESAIDEVYQKLLAYIQKETVGKGYDNTYGWVHTLAHAADALDALILLTELTNDQRQQLVKEIISKMAFPHQTLSHEEDERMAIAIISALKMGISPRLIESVLTEKTLEVVACWKTVNEANMHIRANFKQFIRSLYFCTVDYPDLQKTLLECEQLFSGIYHNKPSS
ncbi:DUF2785 domain-containing protein [Terribacillus saccharophilus]|uniref:DUF2785 domain-containing protein n=1 Tax=Terribacillus saccharophilus TaxID=361277 RepID=UPI003982501E